MERPRNPGGQVPQAVDCLHWGKEGAWPGPQLCSQMFWMILQAIDEFAHWLPLIAYPVHSHEQRKPRIEKERPSSVFRHTPTPPTPPTPHPPPNPPLLYSPTFELRQTLALNFQLLRIPTS